MAKLIFLLTLFLVFFSSNVYSGDDQLRVSCGGDLELLIGCFDIGGNAQLIERFAPSIFPGALLAAMIFVAAGQQQRDSEVEDEDEEK